MEYLNIRDASALTQTPERTLRHQLSTGKLRGKKEGQMWFIEVESLKSTKLLEKFEIILPPPPPVSHRDTIQSQKDHSPFSFGIFRALFEFRLTLLAEPTAPDGAKTRIDTALNLVVAGYFEFSRTAKAEFYRRARTVMAELWLTLTIAAREKAQADDRATKDPTNSLQTLAARVLTDLLPGISGTLRKIEGGKPYAKKPKEPEPGAKEDEGGE